MPSSPGTVSKILWHFTGGPVWDDKAKCQTNDLKPIEKSYDALVEILKSKEVWLGGYREVIKAKLGMMKGIMPLGDEFQHYGSAPVTVESDQVVCLADIPIMHLGYHGKRYGRIAIGFHRHSVIRHGFHPVFYQFQESPVLREIYAGFAAGETGAKVDVEQATYDLQEIILKSEHAAGRLVEGELLSISYDALGVANVADRVIAQSRKTLKTLLAFVKTFSADELDVIYPEREWRSTKTFDFAFDDVSMVVLPRGVDDASYFEKFVYKAREMNLPPTLSIVAWEDLIEH
jgi:Putative abortive phage resistance protein AbiGi, antitoxin